METPAPLPPVTTGSPMREDNTAKIKRANQACLNCRKRKSRCLLDADGSTPCHRCKRDNLECVLGGSNRGGRRVRRKTIDSHASHILPSPTPYTQDDTGFHGLGNVGTSPWPRPAEEPPPRVEGDRRLPRSTSTASDDPFSNLQNPSDALGILARVAENTTPERQNTTNGQNAHAPIHGPAGPPTSEQRQLHPHPHPQQQQLSYRLLDIGVLTVPKIGQLLARYRQDYHPYYPLAPVRTFDLSSLAETVQKERHLLTAVLVISSKDLVEEPHIYESCCDYMKLLVSDLAAGGDADVEAVEALLLLAEWAPYTQRASGKVGKGEEDKESWMHVGLALRIAYFLGLDKYSFRVHDDSKDPQHDRKRLVWTAAFISDRHISIRIGKAFWSRGPGPLTTLRREDYPSLLPPNPNEEDYASIFQATLELTQLFSNVHDVLYSNPGSSFRSHLSGGYIKFIDDFRSAIYGWKSVWGTLTCSSPLKAALLMSYDYLRLYTNAFAFQATVRRALPLATKDASNPASTTSLSNTSIQAPQRVFYNNVGAVGDARFIYEGLDAAKAILTTLNNFVDPEKSLRFMPLRFYLYLVYAGVFLYRARCTGVIGNEEDRAVRLMVNETIVRLSRSSGGAAGHPGSRYSQLLRLLWAKVPRRDNKRPPNSSLSAPFSPTQPHPPRFFSSAADAAHPLLPGFPSTPQARPPPSQAGSGSTGESPAVTEQMGDFSWTDLMAVGDFAMNGAGGGAQQGEENGLWPGFLPLDLGMGGQGGAGGAGWENGGGFEGGELGMAF